MTLGGRSIFPPLIAALAVISAALLFLLPSLAIFMYAAPAFVLAVLIFARLRDAQYSLISAAAITGALFAQPQLLPVLARLDGPVWLGLLIYALSASLADSMERSGARAIIVLGVSLAALLAADPAGVFLDAAIIPLLAVQPHLRRNTYEAVSFAMLVLFAPCVTALLLSQFHIAPAAAMPLWPIFLTRMNLVLPWPITAPSPWALFSAVAIIMPAALVPAVLPLLRSRASRVCAMLGLSIVAAFAASTAFGAHREVCWLAAGLLPVAGVLLASLRPTPRREMVAVAAASLSMIASWIAWAL